MSSPTRWCRIAAAASWTADVGPPRTELLSRAERSAASFSARILAHVIGELSSHPDITSLPRPWVHGVTDLADTQTLRDPVLLRIIDPSPGPLRVHAGRTVVPMTLLEGMALLEDHDAVLVTFGQDAIAPHHEALAAALILTRESPNPALVLHPPVLRRTSSHLGATGAKEHPLSVSLRIVRAINVGQPTIETVACRDVDHQAHWRIELGAVD